MTSGEGGLTPNDYKHFYKYGDLSLTGRNLTRVPREVFGLNISKLDLSENWMTSLPPEIGRLVRLKELVAKDNRLTSVPPQLGALSHLESLNLSGNRLQDLPEELARLESLTSLLLNENQLEALPRVVPQLRNLKAVWLDKNRLTALPETIGALRRLENLRLACNQLVTLPPAIERLFNLTTLHLEENKITDLPPQIGFLENLHQLFLDRNGLTAFPREIVELTDLKELRLDGNMIAELPPEIGQLASLQVLTLARNRLTCIPAEIADLGKLRELCLDGNQITELPSWLARLLKRGLVLKADDNPLSDPLPEYIKRGPGPLAAYLERADEQFEAKVLLLGEGDVGKTCLVAALHGEPFVERRPSTPGIQISSLTLPHPKWPEVNMTLRLWDFGGQEDYRITHQLFISQCALYLVVWYPRQGWAGGNVETWLRGIMLRTGQSADWSVRVMIVATHSDDSRGRVDYARLERDFPGMLAGHFEVDSRTGAGLEELRTAIVREAARLPRMGVTIGVGWAAARAEVLRLAETRTYIPFAEFAGICERNEVPKAEAEELARMMHDLGLIVYYGDDPKLRDIVVLNPQWLTRAVSSVLNDVPTREADGVLDHARLAEIWQDRPGMPGYPRDQYRFFLWLMEKFDVSYRLEDDDRRSLIAQLVPSARPDLPWDSGTPLAPGTRPLVLCCRLAEAAPGLIAWLTVRLHRWSTGKHWRHGVFLRYRMDEYNSEALIELHRERELMIEVRAPSPDSFFDVLIESLCSLLEERWPDLRHELLVPCPSRDGSGTPCTGEFPREFLRHCQEQGQATASCRQCYQDHDVELLLTGFSPPPSLERIQEGVKKILAMTKHTDFTVTRTHELVAQAQHSLRQLLAAAEQEVKDCPRLFTLTPERKGGRRTGLFERRYRLVLWCEYSYDQHPQGRPYPIGQPHEWIIRVRPYLTTMLKTLEIFIPLAGAASALTLPGPELARIRADLDVMRDLVRLSPPPDEAARRDDVAERADGDTLSRAEGEALRALRQLIFHHDSARRFGGLRRCFTETGQYLWLCPDHYAKYDRGLPQLLPELCCRTACRCRTVHAGTVRRWARTALRAWNLIQAPWLVARVPRPGSRSIAVGRSPRCERAAWRSMPGAGAAHRST